MRIFAGDFTPGKMGDGPVSGNMFLIAGIMMLIQTLMVLLSVWLVMNLMVVWFARK